MYLDFSRFFGLRGDPFRIDPEPAYFFESHEMQSSLDSLAGAIRARKGLLLLIGEVGTGKTTLLHRLMHWLNQQRAPTAFIFNPHLQPNELFDLMLAGFGIPFDARLHGNARTQLSRWLVDEHRLGKNAVLILDEAQGLPVHVLEEVRLLLNQEIQGEKLLQIVLCGQPEFEERLRRHDLRQIRQRISLRCETRSLTREEAHIYIQKRLDIAGASDGKVFTPEAVDAVHFYAEGIPRVMNLLCEHALIQAHVKVLRVVSVDVVKDVARQLQFDDIRPVAGPINVLESGSSAPPEWQPPSTQFADSSLSSTVNPGFMAVGSQEPTADNDLETRPLVESILRESLGDQSKFPPGCVLDSDTKERAESGKGTVLKSVKAEEQNAYKDKASRIVFAFGASALNLAKRLAAAGRATSKNLLSFFLSPSIRRVPGKLALRVNSPNWEKHLESLIRWLRQPMSTPKIHRTNH